MKPVMTLDADEHTDVRVALTIAGRPVIYLRKRPFLQRLARSYSGYRGKPLYMGRWRAFWLAWHASTL